MAKESFDKEIQFLRMLVLTSGAYNRQQFADRLGISVHTFDKTLRRLKEIMTTVSQNNPEMQDKEFAETLRFSYYDHTDPMLLFLFRAKSLKESESQRISILLAAIQESSATAMELLDHYSNHLATDSALPDEKTIRTDLKYLEAVGVIKKESSSRPYRYRMNDDIIQELSDDELTDLYDFVDVMSNTQVPSVQGYLLRDSLKKHLQRTQPGQRTTEPFLYKYHYHSRILDEAHLFTLLSAIRDRRKVTFVYFTPKSSQSYTSKNTNPLFTREMEGKQHQTMPLKIVYDHQYGRWYLLSHDSRHGLRKYRMEGITELHVDELVPPAWYEEKLQELEHKIQRSWLIDTSPAVIVKAKFYNPGPQQPNFIRERVLLQGQWGQIIEENDQYFIYEIEVNGVSEIKPWIRSFGSSCEVLQPPGLRAELIEEWKEIAATYESI